MSEIYDRVNFSPGDKVTIYKAGDTSINNISIHKIKSVDENNVYELEDGRKYYQNLDDYFPISMDDDGTYISNLSTHEDRKAIRDIPYLNTIMKFAAWYDPSKWRKLLTKALKQIARTIDEYRS